MNIVYCIPSLAEPGGMERVLTQKVNYLASTGKYNLTIVTLEQKGRPAYFSLHTSVRVVDLHIDFAAHVGKNILSKLWHHYRKQRLYRNSLRKYLHTHPADLVISLGGKEIEFISSLDDKSVKIAEFHFVKAYKKQFLLANHTGRIWEWIGDFYVRKLESYVRSLSCLVVLTEADCKAWSPKCRRVVRIANPIVCETVVPERPESKTFISAGRMDALKGFDFMIRAWKEVAALHPDWQLHIWGDGEKRKELESQIRQLGLDNQVYLKGKTDKLMEEYRKSYAFVLSSLSEAFPMVLLEASSCGLPLLSFDCPSGPAEIIDQEVNGYLVPVGDCTALAKRICYLIEHPQVHARMADAALASSKNYDIEKIMKQWMDLFDSLLQFRKK